MVKNFSISAKIDGRKTPLITGPKKKNGGFSLVIHIRENGEVSSRKVVITGEPDGERLVLSVKKLNGDSSGEVLRMEAFR